MTPAPLKKRPFHLSAAGEDAPDQHNPADRVPNAKEEKGERYRHPLPEAEANDAEQQRADADEEAEENNQADEDVAEGHGTGVAARRADLTAIHPPSGAT